MPNYWQLIRMTCTQQMETWYQITFQFNVGAAHPINQCTLHYTLHSMWFLRWITRWQLVAVHYLGQKTLPLGFRKLVSCCLVTQVMFSAFWDIVKFIFGEECMRYRILSAMSVGSCANCFWFCNIIRCVLLVFARINRELNVYWKVWHTQRKEVISLVISTNNAVPNEHGNTIFVKLFF